MPETTPPIRHPAKFVPLSAIAYGAPGSAATPVTAENPVPVRDQALRSARALEPDVVGIPGHAVLIDCAASGRAELQLADDLILPLTLAPGVTLLPLAVKQLLSAGTTAAVDAWVLD